MEYYFKIYQTSIADERPPISHKIREYFEDFVIEHVLKSKKIILGGRWKIHLTILFIDEFPLSPDEKIFLPKGARTVSREQTKKYHIQIAVKFIQNANISALTTIELLYEALTVFLTSTYKKVKPEFMAALWEKVDIDYLLSLPYPASAEEQKYLVTIEKDGTTLLDPEVYKDPRPIT